MSSISCRYLFLSFVLTTGVALASSFNLVSNSTTAQTLGSGSGQTGNVAAGVSLTVGGATVAVTISGNNATLTNLGTIQQTGTGRVIRDNTGVSGLIINNGSTTNSTALMLAADGDVIQMNKTPASVTLNNYGKMQSLNASTGGAQAVDFNAILSGTNVINNFSTGLMLATDADVVRPGVNGTVYNAGTMRSTLTVAGGTDGIDAQNNSGVGVTNDTTGLVDGARHGIAGAQVDATTAFLMNVTNNAGGVIRGSDGSGINIDGFNGLQTVTIVNHGTISGNGLTGDGDGVDVDGLVNITNTGAIRSMNAFSSGAPAQSEGITVGGGTIMNSGTIAGMVAAGNTNAVGRGITLAGNDITSGPLAGTREAIYGDALITNQSGGLILGQSDSGIAVEGPASGHSVTINNNAGGTIQGGGLTTAAILTGADNDTIINSGLIDGASSGSAIAMGAGNNSLTILGGSASVRGSIDGGIGGTNVLTFDLGTGNTFGYSGPILHFSLVETLSGLVTLSGANTYTGTTRITGGTLDLDGANRISASSSLDLNGGRLRTSNAGGANGETFNCLSVSNSSTIDLDDSSLTFGCLGAIGSGVTLNVVDYSGGVSPAYAFRFLGDISSNAAFLALINGTTIDGGTATFSFDGVFTNVTASPEPSTLALIGLALAGLVGLRARQWGRQSCPRTRF